MINTTSVYYYYERMGERWKRVMHKKYRVGFKPMAKMCPFCCEALLCKKQKECIEDVQYLNIQ